MNLLLFLLLLVPPIFGLSGDFTSVTYLVSFCNVTQPNTKSAVESIYFNNTWNIRGFFSSCSHGAVTFHRENNIVLEVTIPCTGTSTSGREYNSSRCGANEIFGWAETAEHEGFQRHGVNASNYNKRIMLLPAQVFCGWSGLGMVGGPYAWIKGGHTNIIDTYLHEIGHIIGLQHSSVPGSEYGDSSSPMGNCCDTPRCFNAAQQWQLGWVVPINLNNHVNHTTTLFNRWQYMTLPAMTVNSQSVIRLFDNMFVSFRKNHRYDSGLRSTYYDRLNVHVYNGSITYSHGYLSELIALLPLGRVWNIRDISVQFKEVQFMSLNAIVGFCKRSSMFEENCVNGEDEDCDGLIDSEDPDCALFGPRTSIPSEMWQCNNNMQCDWMEFAWNCPSDCDARCGDRYCDKLRGENVKTCPFDCEGFCGDGVCHARGNETWRNCRVDCPAPAQICGDGRCVDLIEDRLNCPKDCCPDSRCGDGRCDVFKGEHCENCPMDCNRNSTMCCGLDGSCKDSRCSAGMYVCRTTCSASESAVITRIVI